MQQFMLIFSSQVQMRMSLDFPPQERSESILPGTDTSQRMVGSSEVEINLVAMGNNEVDRRQKIQVNSTHHNFPVPKLELPVFNEAKPRWWIRQCEKLFEIHQVVEEQKINMPMAYLNDIGDVWHQGWSKVRKM